MYVCMRKMYWVRVFFLKVYIAEVFFVVVKQLPLSKDIKIIA